MTNKKSLFLCFLSIFFLSSYGMDEFQKQQLVTSPPLSPSKRLPPSSPPKSPSKKRRLDNPSEPDTKKVRIEKTELSFYMAFKQDISHFDSSLFY